LKGYFNLSVSGTWAGTLTVQRSWDSGDTWLDVDTFIANKEEYGLEHGKMQFIMFEKQHITYDTKKKAYIKDGGSPKYHLVPVFWGPLRDAQGEEITDEETGEVIEDWITVQAPGECRPEGVCEVALSKYVYETRCSPKDLEAKESCYGYYGVREVVKPKFVLK